MKPALLALAVSVALNTQSPTHARPTVGLALSGFSDVTRRDSASYVAAIKSGLADPSLDIIETDHNVLGRPAVKYVVELRLVGVPEVQSFSMTLRTADGRVVMSESPPRGRGVNYKASVTSIAKQMAHKIATIK